MTTFAAHRQGNSQSLPSHGTGLLVSVRDAGEARLVLAGGADWIDLKEPDNGALGAVPRSAAEEVVSLVAGRVPVSAAGGELSDWNTSSAKGLLTVSGIKLIKLGLAGCASKEEWSACWSAAAIEIESAGKQLVAVAYADSQQAKAPAVEEVLTLAIRQGLRTLLIDTFDKTSGTLRSYLTKSRLSDLLERARRADMRTVVAGRLVHADLARLPLEVIDLVAVRSAACEGDREGKISAARVEALLERLHGESWSKNS